jgi:hypothetical protein
MMYRIAIWCLLLSGCGTTHRIILTYEVPPPLQAPITDPTWQRLITERLNAVVECLSVTQKTCIDDKEGGY